MKKSVHKNFALRVQTFDKIFANYFDAGGKFVSIFIV